MGVAFSLRLKVTDGDDDLGVGAGMGDSQRQADRDRKHSERPFHEAGLPKRTALVNRRRRDCRPEPFRRSVKGPSRRPGGLRREER
jgi:hypothetical protein